MTTEVFQQLEEVVYGVDPEGVIHVGAHKGQEVADYRRAGFERIVLVEPNPYLIPGLRQFSDVVVVECAVGMPGRAVLHITEWDERSSLLTPSEYLTIETVEVDVQPLIMLQGGCNVAVLDCQGSELTVLETADMDRLDIVIVESTVDPRYYGAATSDDIDGFMLSAGWSHFGDYGGHSPNITDSVWRNPSCA